MNFRTCIFISICILNRRVTVQAWTSEELELFDLVDDINQNFYEVLGLDQNAVVAEIRKAYRRLSLQYHPDKNKNPGAEEQFRKIVAVSEVLKDDERRKQYDLILRNGLPDWKQPIFYYRRVRKMGLVELFTFMTILLTTGHYILSWATYWERKYELEEVLGARGKKKKSKKGKAPDSNNEELIAREVGLIPKPSMKDLLPALIVKMLVNFALGLPSRVSSWRIQRQNLELSEEESGDEDTTEEMTRKPRKKVKPEIPDFYSLAPTSINGVSSEDNNNTCTKNFTEMQVAKPRDWNDKDVVHLVKAMNKFPVGTSDRWRKVASYLDRTVEEVCMKVKTLKSSVAVSHPSTALQGLTGNEATDPIREADPTYEERDVEADGASQRTKLLKEGERECKVQDGESFWSQNQQKALETALQKFPKGCEDRWDCIASKVEGKSKEECLLRYKILVELIKKRKSQHAQ